MKTNKMKLNNEKNAFSHISKLKKVVKEKQSNIDPYTVIS